MRKVGKKSVCSLAGIDDMLSSICGAQNSAPDIALNRIEHDTQETAENGIMHGQNIEALAPIPDEEPTTPEKSVTRKEHPNRRHSRMQTRSSRASKPLPTRNRVRKSRSVRVGKSVGKRSTVKAADPPHEGPQQDYDLEGAVPRDIDDEAPQPDYDLEATVPRHIDDEIRPQNYEFLGTSSDERENAKLLSQMKLLANEKIKACKKKNDAMNVNAVNAMKRDTDQCTQKMKQIAGHISSGIIDRAAQVEGMLPRNLREQTAREMNTVRRETDAFVAFQRSQTKEFHVELNKLLQSLTAERRGNKEKHDAREKEMYESTRGACERGQQLVSVLEEIDKMLDFEQFKQK